MHTEQAHGMAREELNEMSAICCILVILIHVLSFSVVSLDKSSWQLAVIYFPWQMSAFVVPAFLFCGGAKLGLQICEDRLPPYSMYLKRRLVKIYLPYVAATLVYFAVFVSLGWMEGSGKALLSYLLSGSIAAPFYYVVLTMQFYLLLPLWQRVIVSVPPQVGIPGAAMISLAMLYLPSALGRLGIAVVYTDRVFTTYLYYWIIGLYTGSDYDSVCRALWQCRKNSLLCAPLLMLFYAISYTQFARGVYLCDTGGLKMLSDVLVIYLLLTLCLEISYSKMARLRNALAHIAADSYPVYLYHCLFLELTNMLSRHLGIAQAEHLLLLRAAVCYTAPFLLCDTAGRVKRRIQR